MRLLIDTNVVLDYLKINKGFSDEAEKVFNLAIEKKAVELVSASAATDIYYVLRKQLKDSTAALERLKDLRKFIDILPVTQADVDNAINRNWKDFEDAVQYSVAESNHVDYIITRDTKGFEEDEIPALTPADFMNSVTIP